MSPSKPVVAALVALTLLALACRLWGIGYGAPVWEEPDPDVPGHVDELRGQPTLAGVEHPDEQYPHLLAHLARWREPRPDPGEPRTLDEHLAAASWTHVQVRELVAALAALLVPATWLLARRFVRDGWALLAAALVATSLLHQSFAQQARPHGAAATLFALAVLADLHLVRRASAASYVLAGLATAGALGTLHSAAALVIPGLAAHLLRRGGGQRALDAKLLVPIALSIAAIAAFYPFLLDGSGDEHATVEGGALRFAEHSLSLGQFDGRGFLVVARVLWNYEPLVTLLLPVAVAGALVAWRARATRPADPLARAELLVVLAFAVPYLLAIGLFELTYERFVLPLLPFAALAIAGGLSAIAARLGGRARVALASLVALALALPASACAKLAWLRSRPDTLGEAAAWLLANAPDEPIHVSASQPLDLPVFRRADGFRPFRERQITPWTRWQVALPPDPSRGPSLDLRWLTGPSRADMSEHVASLAPGLFVIERFERRRRHAALHELREALGRAGERVGTFSPDPDPDAEELELFFQLSDHFNEGPGDAEWPHFTFRLLAARALGPVVEIWRVPARPAGR